MQKAMIVLAAASLLAGCTRVQVGGVDLFEGDRPREGSSTYTVRLEVGCESCTVRYMFGSESATDRGRLNWRRRVLRTPLIAEAVRLDATPREVGDVVYYVRIIVDGEVVAEQGCRSCEDPGRNLIRGQRETLSVEHVLTPR